MLLAGGADRGPGVDGSRCRRRGHDGRGRGSRRRRDLGGRHRSRRSRREDLGRDRHGRRHLWSRRRTLDDDRSIGQRGGLLARRARTGAAAVLRGRNSIRARDDGEPPHCLVRSHEVCHTNHAPSRPGVGNDPGRGRLGGSPHRRGACTDRGRMMQSGDGDLREASGGDAQGRDRHGHSRRVERRPDRSDGSVRVRQRERNDAEDSEPESLATGPEALEAERARVGATADRTTGVRQ